MFPGTALPPKPIVTRWGTWIEASLYYAEHFEKVKKFLNELDSSEAKSIAKAISAIVLPSLKKSLAFIKSNFDCLVTGVMQLQGKGMSLAAALEIIESVHVKLQSMHGRPEFVAKFNRVIPRNNGFLKMKEISTILSTGLATQPDEFIDSLTPDEVNAFLYAPITSCDVERTFSKYKQVLGEQRRSFLFDNLKMHVLIYCNHFD